MAAGKKFALYERKSFTIIKSFTIMTSFLVISRNARVRCYGSYGGYGRLRLQARAAAVGGSNSPDNSKISDMGMGVCPMRTKAGSG